MSRRGASNDCKVYVGDLPKDASEKEVEKAFSYFGRLRSVWVARNPPGFAFVEFEDYRDAEDAIKELDGSNICGGRCRVELSSGKVRPKPWLRGGRGPPQRYRRSFNPDDRCYECGERGHYAYDCSSSRRGGRSSRRKSRSYSRDRSYSRSRSRSKNKRDGRGTHSRSRSRSRSHRSDRSRNGNKSPHSDRSRSRSAPPKSRSPSPQ